MEKPYWRWDKGQDKVSTFDKGGEYSKNEFKEYCVNNNIRLGKIPIR